MKENLFLIYFTENIVLVNMESLSLKQFKVSANDDVPWHHGTSSLANILVKAKEVLKYLSFKN